MNIKKDMFIEVIKNLNSKFDNINFDIITQNNDLKTESVEIFIIDCDGEEIENKTFIFDKTTQEYLPFYTLKTMQELKLEIEEKEKEIEYLKQLLNHKNYDDDYNDKMYLYS